MLAATGRESPSVIQVRTQNPTPQALGVNMLSIIRQFQSHLEEGALVTVHLDKAKARILPIY